MKGIPNIVLLILGVIILAIEFIFMINGTLGWLLTSGGIILIGASLFKGNNPFKVIVEFISKIF